MDEMRKFNYNFSVIIPHKNNINLLKRCLMSIPCSDDIEIIIVDDNSELSHDQFPQREHLKYVYLTSDNSNYAGHARNIGLDVANGKWLIFSDADDYFSDNAFEYCRDYLNSSYDIVYFDIDATETLGNKLQEYKNIYGKQVRLTDNHSQASLDKLRFMHDVPWGKMISHELVNKYNIRFGETRYSNDTLFSTLTAVHASSIYSDKRVLYCVTATEGSLSVTVDLDAKFIRYEVQLQKNLILRKYGYSHHQSPIILFVLYFLKKDVRSFVKAIKLGNKYKSRHITGILTLVKFLFKKVCG